MSGEQGRPERRPTAGGDTLAPWAAGGVALLAVLYAAVGLYGVTQSIFCGQLGPDVAAGCAAGLLGTLCLPSLLAIPMAGFLLWRRRLRLALAVALLPALVMFVVQLALALTVPLGP